MIATAPLLSIPLALWSIVGLSGIGIIVLFEIYFESFVDVDERNGTPPQPEETEWKLDFENADWI